MPESGREIVNDIVNALTIDVEEYFHVTNLAAAVRPEDWAGLASSVRPNTERLLALLAEAKVSATFFVLGWVAERDPALVRQIHAQGHEVACHGYSHELVHAMSPEAFRDDLRRARSLLEDLTGEAVAGYRAPSWSITPWALDILAEEGFRYDASIMPLKPGASGAPRFPHLVRANGSALAEFPVTTLRLLGLKLPVAGGGYFRLYPYRLTRAALSSINRQEGRPFVFYLHPWEIDPAQPRPGKVSPLKAFRHYVNLSRTERRLQRLLADFRFAPIRHVLEYGQSDAAARLACTLPPSSPLPAARVAQG